MQVEVIPEWSRTWYQPYIYLFLDSAGYNSFRSAKDIASSPRNACR